MKLADIQPGIRVAVTRGQHRRIVQRGVVVGFHPTQRGQWVVVKLDDEGQFMARAACVSPEPAAAEPALAAE